MTRFLCVAGLFALMLASSAVTTAAQDEKPGKGKGKGGAGMVDRIFDSADANKDGKISKDEYKKWTEEFAARIKEKTGKDLPAPKGSVDDRFAGLDTDKDGFLSKEELAKSFGGRGKGKFEGKGKGKGKADGDAPPSE
ncbi:EF-hand domain-containing protein [Tuwongella immobilis]|uniref:Calcium-binding protein:: EF-hand_7 n=1 Tax=Tuwongella immobilis TaxID=692036 RepID=A0A6C2YK60_9BACT|nr:hypothetical protein [Tuwongella immobilis]VIP01968.1 calcium-binding protein : : EF-hand_7 [Tuwongella immobilis]VTR99990.1 calcium-binding protein : : EF-hand_7 [Tuwongella immobilis]